MTSRHRRHIFLRIWLFKKDVFLASVAAQANLDLVAPTDRMYQV